MEQETEIHTNKHTFRITSSAHGEALQYLVSFQSNSSISTVFVLGFFKLNCFEIKLCLVQKSAISVNFNKKASDTINQS